MDFEIIKKKKLPKLILCATLWHETQAEIVKLLKSIFRLDEDQYAKSKAHFYKKHKERDEKYFKLECKLKIV